MPRRSILHRPSRRAALTLLAAAVLGLGGWEVVCQWEGHAMTKNARTAAPGSTLETGAACSLPSVELEKRRALFAREVLPFVTGVVRGDGVLRLVLKTPAPATKALAEKMAALEADCCSFMTIRYADDISPSTIEIRAPDTFLDLLLTWGFGGRRSRPNRRSDRGRSQRFQ